LSTINSDEHDAEHGVRSGREQPLALEHRNEPGAYFVPTGNRTGNKGGDVMRAGASARTSKHDRAFIRPAVPGVHVHDTTGISCRNTSATTGPDIICDKPKNNIMVSLWCMEKKSIAEILSVLNLFFRIKSYL